MPDFGPGPFRAKGSTSNWLPVRKVLGLRLVDACPSETHATTPIYYRSRRGNKTMSTHDSDSPAPTEARRLRFDRYVLDLDRGSLLQDGSEVALRPKTFAGVAYLVENSGRLVSKDEPFAAVWPNLAVTDDALVQSIGELRALRTTVRA